MVRTLLILLALASPALAGVKRAAVVTLTVAKDADAETRAFAEQLSAELRRLIATGVGPYRSAAGPDPALVAEIARCRPEVKCLAIIGAETNADRVVYGTVRRKDPGFHVHLVLVDVTRRRYERIVNSVMWEDASDVRTFRAWARKHYAKLLGGRGARSS